MRRFTWVLAVAAHLALGQGYIDRASRSATDVPGNADSTGSALSGNGRLAAFVSGADNLVPSDTNGRRDVFIRNRFSGLVDRVSISSSGLEQDQDAIGTPAVSEDGRFVAFSSASNLLVLNDTNGVTDVFVRDRTLNTTIRVSIRQSGAQTTGASVLSGISQDGRYVLFQSNDAALVAGDTNGVDDLFVRDLSLLTTQRVSVGSGGIQSDQPASAGSISANGRYVAWQTESGLFDPYDQNGLYDVYVRDLVTGVTTRASRPATIGSANGYSVDPSVANDGSVAFRTAATTLFAGDSNGVDDIVVAIAGVPDITAVSLTSEGVLSNGVNLTPSISADARFVAFSSSASNLTTGDTNTIPDVFVRDLFMGETVRVSVDVAGSLAQAPSTCWPFIGCLPIIMAPVISANGAAVAFEHIAPNLTPVADADFIRDVFVADIFPRVRRIPGSIGTASLLLEAPGDVGRGFVGALALDYRPGIVLGARVVPLVDDGLLQLTLGSASPPWVGFSGMIPVSGMSLASFPVPTDPSLNGIIVYFSFATIDFAELYGVGSLANAIPVALGN